MGKIVDILKHFEYTTNLGGRLTLDEALLALKEAVLGEMPEKIVDYDHNGVTFVETMGTKYELGYNQALTEVRERITKMFEEGSYEEEK